MAGGKTGNELGADLAAIWHAGARDLPLAADDYQAAWVHTPSSLSGLMGRGGGLGHNPGVAFDSFCDQVNKMLIDTRRVLLDLGTALVWIADEYVATDQSARQAFEDRKTYLLSQD